MYTFFYVLFHLIFFGLLYLIGRAIFYAFTKKDISVSNRIFGVNAVSVILSLFVNKFIIGYRLPVFVWGNYRSMILNFIAFVLVYFVFKFLLLRKKPWRGDLLKIEKEWVQCGLIALPTLVLFIAGIGLLIYVEVYAVIYMFAGLAALILIIAFFPWLIIFFV